jgi:hypothetical protein
MAAIRSAFGDGNMKSAKGQWVIAIIVALVFIAMTSLPYILGYALARPGLTFTGTVMNPEDSESYFAKMLEGYEGHWLYTIPFTTEAHSPAFVGGFYLGLGHIARVTGLTLDAMWHLARVVAELILCMTCFGFIADQLQDLRERWTAHFLALFGSGLGWVLFLLNQPYWLDAFPVDFKMPEAHLFFAALTFPHVALGTALIMTNLWFTRRILEERSIWWYSIAAGVANLLLAIVYPFLIYLTAAVAGLYWLIQRFRVRKVQWRSAVTISVAFLIPLPLLINYAYTLVTNPVFRSWDTQSITLSPPLPHYFIAYGVMLLLAGLLWIDREKGQFVFLAVWVAAVCLLVYSPLNSQRRFVEGVQVPLAILATAGLCRVALPWLEQTRAFRWLAAHPRYSVAGLERLVIVLFLVGMALSNFYILASLSVTMVIQQPDPLFRSRNELEATEWLNAHTQRNDVVLSDYETGNYVAARAGNAVVVGHWAETVDYEIKKKEVFRFFGATTDEATRRELLARFQVRYVWYGPRERALGAFDPTHADYLEPVFSNSDAEILKVRP